MNEVLPRYKNMLCVATCRSAYHRTRTYRTYTCTQAYIKHSSYMTVEMVFFQTHTMGSLQIKKATFSYTMFGVTAHVAGTKPFPYLLEILSYWSSLLAVHCEELLYVPNSIKFDCYFATINALWYGPLEGNFTYHVLP